MALSGTTCGVTDSAEELDDSVELTQFVFFDEEPRNAPRPRDQDGLSLLRGRLSTNQAARYVRRKSPSPFDGDSVRHTTVGQMRRAGFVIKATPSRSIPIHVSVSTEAEWEEITMENFASCFTEAMDVWERGDGNE